MLRDCAGVMREEHCLGANACDVGAIVAMTAMIAAAVAYLLDVIMLLRREYALKIYRIDGW